MEMFLYTQPPLYKVKRGNSENYLKDRAAFEDFLIDGGLEGAILKADGGERRSGRDLRANVERARSFVHVLDGLHMRYVRTVVEQAAIAGLLNPKLVNNEEEAERLAGNGGGAPEGPLGGDGTGLELETAAPDGGFVFSREVRGVKESHNIDWALIQSADARKLHTYHAEFSELFSGKLVLERKSDSKHLCLGRAAFWMRCSRRAGQGLPCSATKVWGR